MRGGNAAGRERRSSDARFAQRDSAPSQIGLHRLSVAEFERRLQILKAFLRGEEVQLPTGTSSSIRWLHDSAQPKVPVHVAATGRRTIAVGARHAEGVDLTVGAELERLRLGVSHGAAGRPSRPDRGAYINVAVDPDRDLVCGSIATFARFSSQQSARRNRA
ncbi:MAG: LLM class flavin-dependent oxidoreductase [Solirubrobacteraceae bacterium]